LFIKLLQEVTNVEISDEIKEMFQLFIDKDAVQGLKDFSKAADSDLVASGFQVDTKRLS